MLGIYYNPPSPSIPTTYLHMYCPVAPVNSVGRVVRSRKLVRRMRRRGIDPRRRRRMRLDKGVACMLESPMLRPRIECLLLRLLRMVRRLVLVQGDALLWNSVVVGLCRRLHLELVRRRPGPGSRHTTGPRAAAAPTVPVDDDGICHPRDEEQRATKKERGGASVRTTRDQGCVANTYNSTAPRQAMPATTPPKTL